MKNFSDRYLDYMTLNYISLYEILHCQVNLSNVKCAWKNLVDIQFLCDADGVLSSLICYHKNINVKTHLNTIQLWINFDETTDKLTSWFNNVGRMSSKALAPTVECRLSNVFAAACLTSGNGSHSAFLTVGTRELTKFNTISLDVEAMISDSPIQTPCRWSAWSDCNPLSNIGMISGRTLSPSFLTKSPNVLAATCRLS